MPKRYKGRLSAQEWQFHIDAWETSDLTRAEYCRQENISLWSFIDWRKKLKSQPETDNSPLKLVKLDPSICTSQSFEQNPALQLAPIRFWVNGYCVEVSTHFSPETLSQLIKTLRRH